MAESKTTKTEALPQGIVQIIPRIREELGPIGKDQQAQGGARYKYRSADQIIDAVAPLLNKYGVLTTVEDTPIEFRQRDAANNKFVTSVLLSKKVTFYGPDGSSVSSTTLGESSDFSDKATGGASTYAYRYALVQTFTIPVEGSDPDGKYVEMPGSAQKAAPATPAPKNASVDPVQAKRDELKAALRKAKLPDTGPAVVEYGNKIVGDETFPDPKGTFGVWHKSAEGVQKVIDSLG